MKVTSQILASDYQKNLLSDSVKRQKEDEEQSVKVSNDYAEDALSITRENQKALNVSLKTLSEAIEKLNQVKTDITEDPLTALSAQGNIVPAALNSLM